MAASVRKNGKVPLSVRVHPDTIDRARLDAEKIGVPMADYIEMLITRRGVKNYQYFAQQAAFQSFVGAALVIHLSRKAMSKDELAAAQKFVYSAAATLFGQPSERPPEIGEDPDDLDPRVTALFEAYDGW